MEINRYPGTIPFSRKYQHVFYGRDQDIRNVSKYVTVNNLSVLHGKSGLGKSSLINAGLVPFLEKFKNYKCLFVRFTAYKKGDHSISLKEKFTEALNSHLPLEMKLHSFLKLDSNTPIPWLLIKELQLEQGQNKRVLIIIDQFEEVFTYPASQIDELIESLGQVLYNRIPKVIEQLLRNQLLSDVNRYTRQELELYNFLGNTEDVHFLLGIRSDKLSLLNRLKSELPTVMMNHYELYPLSWEQAHQAISIPSNQSESGDDDVTFMTQRFKMSEELIESILSYLTKDKSKPIETFLLQIICSHIERMIRLNEIRGSLIETNLIPDLKSITKGYYISVLSDQKLNVSNQPSAHILNRLLIRFLIEKILIDFRNLYRISIDKNYLENQGITSYLIEFLIDARIIRREPNSVDGVNLELSHDILIEAVRLSMLEMTPLNEEVKSYYITEVKKRTQRVIENLFLGNHGNKKVSIQEAKAILNVDKLLKKGILLTKEDNQLEINPIFIEVVKELLSEARAKKSLKQRKSLLIVIAFSLVALVSTIIAISQNYELKESSKKLLVAQDSISTTLLKIDTLYQASLDSAQKLEILRLNEETNAREADSLRIIAEASAHTSDSLLEKSKDQLLTTTLLQAKNDTLTTIETLRNAIPLITFPEGLIPQRSYLLDSMVSLYLEYGGSDDKDLVKKAFELILPFGLETFRIDSLGSRITSLNVLESNLIVSTTSLIANYELGAVNSAQQIIQEGFNTKNCVLNHDRKMVICYAEDLPEIRFYKANKPLEENTIVFHTSDRINKVVSDESGIFVLWESGFLMNTQTQSQHNTKASYTYDTLISNVVDFQIEKDDLLILTSENFIRSNINWDSDSQQTYKLPESRSFDYILNIPKEEKIILYNSSGFFVELMMNGFNSVKDLAWSNRFTIDANNEKTIYSTHGTKTFKLLDSKPDGDILLSANVKEGITRVTFDKNKDIIYLGTYEGSLFQIPFSLKGLKPFISEINAETNIK